MTGPLVSVVIPVHNGESHLVGALESVFAQDYDPLEVIVVDDGSTDATREVAESFSDVTCLSQERQGPSAARNTGAAAAEGEFIAFLDADDRWLPEKLRLQVGYHLAHPETGYTLTHQRLVIGEEGKSAPWLKAHLVENDHVGFFPSSLVVRREVFQTVGPYDPMITHGESADWFARAKDMGIPYAIIPETLLHKTVHGENMTHQVSRARSQVLRALKASMDRKRGSE
ncbi:glycosyltransferase family A protein [Gemmatimonadota bacterium]